ncbi:copper-containing nitrite reductase [Actinobacillus vicugnae]|uniref:copper-containing nitrite reductase n=1 Tax=Actinobacillus vicugnae TaxID=2573093 RepID=UPI001AD7029F|nr:copper-containing nitrite reductase [Actinobacillus vicugnae]
MKKTLIALCFACIFSVPTMAEQPQSSDSELVPMANLPTIDAELTVAPNVPKPLERNTPARVVVKLETLEKVMEIEKGVQFKYWTFNGSTPAPFIRVREGDMVEVQVSNPANGKMAHAVDFHSAAAPDGGAKASLTEIGKQTTFAFRAMSPGLYLYHCGADPVSVHLGKGMFGLMLVEPKEGLAKVDKEFYLMQNEFYVKEGNNPDIKIFDMNKASYELPDYVVFNGKVGSMLGEQALKAKVGEKVRLFIGNAGPNKVSSFHLIGKPFDTIYVEGGSLKNHHVQTTLIPAGGVTVVEMEMKVPGEYTFIDHSIFRTDKGAKGKLIVEGQANPEIYMGKMKEQIYDKVNPDADVDAGYVH